MATNVSINDIIVKPKLSSDANDSAVGLKYYPRMTPIEKIHSQTRIARRVYIAEWAAKRGMKQADIARGVGVDPGLVSKWVKGTAFPEVKNLVALAEAFSLDDIAKLFRDPDDSDDWLDRIFRDERRKKELMETFDGRSDAEIERMLNTLRAAFPKMGS